MVSTKEMMGKVGVGMLVCDLLLFVLGTWADPSAFLLVGNAFCVVGNVLWVHLLGDWGGNEFYQVIFSAMAIANAFGTKQAYIRWKNMPPEPDSDDDDDDEEEEKGDGSGGTITAGAQRTIEAAPAGKRKQKKPHKHEGKHGAQLRRRKKA